MSKEYIYDLKSLKPEELIALAALRLKFKDYDKVDLFIKKIKEEGY